MQGAGWYGPRAGPTVTSIVLSDLGLLVPRFLRDWVYNLMARNRHHLTSEGACKIPPPEVRERFLDREE